ncbi:MAG: hypothetical protein MI784_16560 [Cytophagales bacterium]|nr:hypothetical protein [Cytophagales bacterium]
MKFRLKKNSGAREPDVVLNLSRKFGVFFCLCILLALGNSLFAQMEFKPVSEWKKIRESEGIRLLSRWILIGDSLKTRQLRFVGEINAEVEDLVYCLRTEEELDKWKTGARKNQLYGYSGNEWVVYTSFGVPKLFSQQDIVVRYRLVGSEGKTIITARSEPDFVPRVPEVNRQEKYEEHWELALDRPSHIRMVFSSIAPSRPVLPRFIQDRFVHPMLIRSIKNLIRLAENRFAERMKNYCSYERK